MTNISNLSSPPPPPPPLLMIPRKKTEQSIKTSVAKHLKNAQCSEVTSTQAAVHEVRRMCKGLRGEGEQDLRNYSVIGESIAPVIQEGPQCGIVAISMASQTLCSKLVDSETIFNAAVSSGYTRQGEIFSANSMLSLAKSQLQCTGCIIEGNLTSRRSKLIHHLLEGHIAIIPYDRDHNNEPCCRRGQKAHWAVISGFVISTGDEHKEWLMPYATQDEVQEHLYCVQATAHIESPPISFLECEICKIFVIVNQGKSLRTHLWNLETLLKSNEQLVELDPQISRDLDNYVVNDLSLELNAKFIVLI